MSIRVCAVVPTFNRRTLLVRCLEAIRNQSHPVESITVVDNGSDDGTSEVLKEAGGLVRVVTLPVNGGGSMGFHKGVEAAMATDCDAFWIMDDDTLPEREALAQLVGASVGPDGALQGVAVSWQNHWGTRIHYSLPTSFLDALKDGLSGTIEVDQGSSRVEVEWFPFVSVLMSRSVPESVGLPRRDLFIYGDDQDYSLRIRSAGYRMWIVPSSRVEHVGGRNVDAASNRYTWRSYYAYRAEIGMALRHRRSLGSLVSLGALGRKTLGALGHCARALVLGDAAGARFIALGLVDGYRGVGGKRVVPNSGKPKR